MFLLLMIIYLFCTKKICAIYNNLTASKLQKSFRYDCFDDFFLVVFNPT